MTGHRGVAARSRMPETGCATGATRPLPAAMAAAGDARRAGGEIPDHPGDPALARQAGPPATFGQAGGSPLGRRERGGGAR